VALLDEKRPGWATKVDLDRLNMSSVYDCVLGQVYGTYDRAMQALGWDGRGINAIEHGFYLPMMSEAWPDLNEEWKVFIEGRQEEMASV